MTRQYNNTTISENELSKEYDYIEAHFQLSISATIKWATIIKRS